MKISELIAELAVVRERYGETEVVFFSSAADGGERCVVNDADAWPDKHGKMECVLTWNEEEQ